ncbi:hypothetical protein C5167_003616 [Papaver somniferum]|uniref:Protein CHUP1, chloroplastic n=1 Tax=Papaver somniferum TaxID=3469 RepID=A0A4Y7L4W9_PAPSO|nr:protein CHUP1, chloroplastic-like [Papaver somniferum]RZC79421.1 hypothetical protein C5167_003616 [Papaver somniferum]
MAANDEDLLQLRLVTKELEACLKRNWLLQTENDRLKQEVTLLQTDVHYLKEQHKDRSLSFSNNLEISTESISPTKHTTQIKSHRGIEVKTGDKERPHQLPKPTPKATCLDLPQEVNEKKLPVRTATVPPPPPPLPSKLLLGSPNAVRRVPAVMEIYRRLTRRETKTDNKITNSGTPVANTRDMIGEIENRSTYLLAIKSDVEAHGDFIRFLTKEVENAAYKDISNVETFVKWLDGKLSYLVDERAVLKHFPQWPEWKADALREAAFNYRDLKNLESEVSSFRDNPKQPILLSLKKMQEIQDRLERSVHNTQRTREGTSKRYRDLQIPWEWMLDAGAISQLKLGSVGLAKEYMRRVARELQTKDFTQKEDLILQGVRFAFRVHQFVGGFNAEAMHAFKELQKVITGCYGQQQHIRT